MLAAVQKLTLKVNVLEYVQNRCRCPLLFQER